MTIIFFALIVILSINGIFSSRSIITTTSTRTRTSPVAQTTTTTTTTITAATKVQETLESPYKIVIDGGSTGSRLHIFEFRSNNFDDDDYDNSNNKDEADDNNNSSSNSKENKTFVERRGSTKVNIPLSNFAKLEIITDHKEGNINNHSNNHTEQGQKQKQDHKQDHNHNYETHAALHLLPLFKYASKVIPEEYHSTTSISIQATAGMRLVKEEQQNKLYDYIYDTLMEHEEFVFDNFNRSDISTLDGVLEGLYGAIAVNYLKGVVDVHLHYNDDDNDSVEDDNNDGNYNGSGNRIQGNDDENDNKTENEMDKENLVCNRKSPFGALDLGGASMQIVYLPPQPLSSSQEQNAQECSVNTDTDTDMTVGDSAGRIYSAREKLPSHEFFSTSYLSYGSDQFRERLWDTWIIDYEKSHETHYQDKQHQHREGDEKVILNPCSFQGYKTEWKGYILLGTGNSRQCTNEVNRLIPHHEKVHDSTTTGNNENFSYGNKKSERSNVVGGIEHPPISGEFYAMSLFFFVMDCVRTYTKDETLLRTWPKPSIHELSNAVESFCSKHWLHDIIDKHGDNAHMYTRREILSERCFESVYIIALLRDGFGFSAHSRDITYSFLVDGSEVEWSLGMAISLFAQEKEEDKREDVSSNLLENLLSIDEDGIRKVDDNGGRCDSNSNSADSPFCDENITDCDPNSDDKNKVSDKDFTVSHFRDNGPLWS
eukprot:CAMPEP_0203676228 /NCGR_PEP_ID=MMETSP0090-20130426/23926_1 /ASSEMBLY_ACC=CAM_ASM_001088 /TAXON_ID=426623 /ORGANISM="Chaetoceros affinis, Strain CCMP159" /LENGTH=712 /DNA_ID=CAMNT_0050542717 /DNA_START=348 /DNA_END=2486 /DNA_ORIENTATION=-